MIDTNPLEDLNARAGASSEDRPAWHAERRTGVTATDIAKLDGGGPLVRRRLVDEKQAEGEPKELQARAIKYGKTREAPLARWVELRHGIKPNSRVFHSAINSLHLATPDGIGIDFDERLQLAEIKTTSKALDKIPRGYLLQMLWQLIVCGADKTLFVWELHNDDWSNWPKRPPQPIGEPHSRWLTKAGIETLLKRTAGQLVITADEFLTLLDSSSAEPEVLPGADELERLAGSLLFHRDAEALAKKEKVKDWDALNTLAADRGEFSEIFAHASMSYKVTATDTATVDRDAAILADPDLFLVYQDALSIAEKVRVETDEWIKQTRDHSETVIAASFTTPKAAWEKHLEAFTTTTTTTSGKLTVNAIKTKDTK